MATYNTDTATYRVTYIDAEYGTTASVDYQTREAAGSAAHDMALEGTVVLSITRH